VLSVIGYGLGSAWQKVNHGLTIAGYALFAVVVVAIAGFIVYRWRAVRREAAARRVAGQPPVGPSSAGPSSAGQPPVAQTPRSDRS
jgi:hypothetical protein